MAGPSTIEVGLPAPAFALPAALGGTVSLADYLGADDLQPSVDDEDDPDDDPQGEEPPLRLLDEVREKPGCTLLVVSGEIGEGTIHSEVADHDG